LHTSTLSLVLIHAAGITKQHRFALFQPPFEQRVREECELDTRYAVCANVLSNYVFSDTAHGARTPNTNSVFSEGRVELLFVHRLRVLLTAPSSLFYGSFGTGASVGLLVLWLLTSLALRGTDSYPERGPTVFFAAGVSRACPPSRARQLRTCRSRKTAQ
jgi:hypothetical protein